ncbi:MAG: sugar nucleotidyltransferase [Patescibacteria group bacterium]|jgi:glucose-1-phosphate thymidylyltransferase
MKGIILAGGLGKRLYPLTQNSSKALLPISGQPMIVYPLKTLIRAGINEIMVVTSGPFAGRVVEYLQDGKKFGLKRLEYTYKEGGTLSALSAAEGFANGESLAVIYADNIVDEDISPAINKFQGGAMVFLKKVSHPEQHAVVVFDKERRIIEVEEKPLKPKNDIVTVGVVLYDKEIFDIARQCQLSPRGELEIPDANKIYLAKGKLNWYELTGFWCDAGTFEGMAEASEYWDKKSGFSLKTPFSNSQE